MPAIFYNIALLPSDALAQKAVSLSHELEAHDTLFTLGERKNLPHLSLYMVQIPSTGLVVARAALTRLATQTKAFTLTTKGYSQSRGYIDVTYNKSPALSSLQMEVIDAVANVRGGTHEEYVQSLSVMLPTARLNVERYGYPNVGSLFRPHLTFTRFEAGRQASLEDVPAADRFSGSYVRLALCELGQHGVCKQQVMAEELLW
jgi:hypothetical protein